MHVWPESGRRQALAVTTALAAAVLGLAACGSSGGSKPVSASAKQTVVFAESGLGTEGQQTQKAISGFEQANPNIKVNLYGVPKGFTQAPGPWQGRNINSIPTIIVKIDGREITRMGSQPGAVPETELADIFGAVR